MSIPFFFVPFAERPYRSDELGAVEFELREVGRLKVPSGRIVVCDPLVDPRAEAVDRTVAPGAYPVVVSIAHLEGGDQRIAGALLHFSDERVVEWHLAVPGAAVPLVEEEPELVGLPVDSGTAGFLSLEAAAAMMERLEAESSFSDRIVEALGRTYRDTREWADVEVGGEPALNAVIFSSGFGDGVYLSVWGLDADGRPVYLIADFGLVGAEEAAERERSG